jgi:hypothetical protein
MDSLLFRASHLTLSDAARGRRTFASQVVGVIQAGGL